MGHKILNFIKVLIHNHVSIFLQTTSLKQVYYIYFLILLHVSLGSASAVAELKSSTGLFGVVRFHQTEKECVIDGTIDGLTPGEHGLHIHEYGDLSQGDER